MDQLPLSKHNESEKSKWKLKKNIQVSHGLVLTLSGTGWLLRTILLLCVQGFCWHVCLCTMHVPNAHRGQMKALNHVELELKMVVSCCVGVENWTLVLWNTRQFAHLNVSFRERLQWEESVQTSVLLLFHSVQYQLCKWSCGVGSLDNISLWFACVLTVKGITEHYWMLDVIILMCLELSALVIVCPDG